MIPNIETFRSIVEDDEPTRIYSATDMVESNMAEIADGLMNGPGVMVIKGAVEPDVIDAATDVFFQLIE